MLNEMHPNSGAGGGGLLKIRAKSLKIWAKSLKIWVKYLNISAKSLKI